MSNQHKGVYGENYSSTPTVTFFVVKDSALSKHKHLLSSLLFAFITFRSLNIG